MTVRPATPADVPFIDSLQKLHSDRVGFMRTSWIETRIAAGQVLVAEGKVASCELLVASEDKDASAPVPATSNQQLATPGSPLGYVISADRYFKRDDVGIVYQLNVAPVSQRKLIGATLLKAVFDRAAYGCKLFCCWCAQDIEANRFWESMGFVPLAYRAGSEKKSRVHIFWQKRIRAGDTGGGATPWWFPAKTDAGAMREDRLVLPIPPGKHWSDEMPVLTPAKAALPDQTDKPRGELAPGMKAKPQPPTPRPRAPVQFGAPPSKPGVVEKPPEPAKVKVKAPRVKKKADPKLVAAARELRDRWLEHVNAGEMRLEGAGKDDVSRALPATSAKPMPLLPAA